MQMFVHSSMVDAVAYGAVALGRRARNGTPISEWLAQQCPLDGQVRILVHPDVFLNQTGLVHGFTHSGSVEYGRLQRQQLLQDIENLLVPHFQHRGADVRAREGLGFNSCLNTELAP
eukprot:TRINITY_DN76141_c0_g1_i1.p1 TRINITY_DN76141_c0_g1~~TRINITY_DN76141_c0_g1_i1.p1  ORF type:complete len:117 (+),score=11.27 TRINITY_DN76141_c0_g1_i1:3-353(+)